MKDFKFINDSKSPTNSKEKSIKQKEGQDKLNQENSKIDSPYKHPYQDNAPAKALEEEDEEKLVKELQSEINLLQDKIESTKNEIHKLDLQIMTIPQNYSPPIFEMEKKKIEDHIKIEINNKEILERMLEIKTNELHFKNEEKRLKEIENSKAKYEGYMNEQKTHLEIAKRDLELANESLNSRDLFYDKEIYELTKAENTLRELLSNLYKETEIGSRKSSNEILLENLRKDLDLYNLLYESKLIEMKAKSFTKENLDDLGLLHEKIRKIEEEMQILRAKQIEETLYSPSKKLASLKYEEQLTEILRLKSELEIGRRNLLIEKEIEQSQKQRLLSNYYGNENLKLQEEIELFKSKLILVKSNIDYYKEKLSEAVFSFSNSQKKENLLLFENNKNLLASQNLEILNLKTQINNLESKVSKLEYPDYRIREEIAYLESELRQREIEINSYLREKEYMRKTIENENMSNPLKGSLILNDSGLTHFSPLKYSYSYLAPSNLPSTESNSYGSYVNISNLESNYMNKTEELKILINKNDVQKIKEEIKNRRTELKNLRDMLYERDITLNRIIKKGEYNENPFLSKVYQERQRIFEIYLNIKNDLALLEGKVGSPSKSVTSSHYNTSKSKFYYSPKFRKQDELFPYFPPYNSDRYTESQNESFIKVKDINQNKKKSP